MAAKTDWTTYAMYAAGAYLLWSWMQGEDPFAFLSGEGGIFPQAPGPTEAGDPGAARVVTRAPDGTIVTTPNGAQQPPPTTHVTPSSSGGSTVSADQVVRNVSKLRNAMVSAASGDQFPMNLWRWGYYYNQVTGLPAPDIDWYQAPQTAGKSTAEAEQVVLTVDEWMDMAERWAVSPQGGSDRGGWIPSTGGFAGLGRVEYADGVYATAATPNRIVNSVSLAANGTPHTAYNPWGQSSSGSASDWDWSTPRYQSRGKEL